MTYLKRFIGSFLDYLWNNIVTHIPIHIFRKSFLRIFNGKVSWSCVVLLHTRILSFWRVEIGERVVINQYSLLDCRRHRVVIENDADIGPYTRIWTTGHLPDSNSHAISGQDVIISHHAWIASDVTILPGVTVGAGAVVAASSVVSKNIPALEIWSGVPAKFLRKRVNDLSYRLNFTPYFE